MAKFPMKIVAESESSSGGAGRTSRPCAAPRASPRGAAAAAGGPPKSDCESAEPSAPSFSRSAETTEDLRAPGPAGQRPTQATAV